MDFIWKLMGSPEQSRVGAAVWSDSLQWRAYSPVAPGCMQMVSGSGAFLRLPSHCVWLSPPSWKAGFAFQWLKRDPPTLQERIRETHHEFATIQHLPEAGWRHLMCVREHWGLMLNIHSSTFFELKPGIELALQKAMCLVRIILVPFRNTSTPLRFNVISLAFI